jgi:FkbM family methyltransferase
LASLIREIARVLKYSRGKKYFSETGEDSVLAGILSEEPGRFVDIGASHPIIGNNTYFLYRRGWSGIAVEPQHQFNFAWKISRPKDRVLNCIVGQNAEVEFYKFKNSLLSTTNLEVAKSHSKRGLNWEKEIVKSVPLSQLLPPSLKPTEEFVLNIDVEGSELECLQTMDFSSQRPRYILLESWSLPWVKKSKALEFLEANGYELIAYTGLTSILVPSEVLISIRGLRQSLSELD